MLIFSLIHDYSTSTGLFATARNKMTQSETTQPFDYTQSQTFMVDLGHISTLELFI